MTKTSKKKQADTTIALEERRRSYYIRYTIDDGRHTLDVYRRVYEDQLHLYPHHTILST